MILNIFGKPGWDKCPSCGIKDKNLFVSFRKFEAVRTSPEAPTAQLEYDVWRCNSCGAEEHIPVNKGLSVFKN